ncbi:hypothetical protein JW758_00310 [Candidatus Peregrinibacteria bacterium]|nr:hypothetical protein [Candidatus Peregrinibacteria bacterium]
MKCNSLKIIIIIVITALISGGSVYLWQNQKESQNTNSNFISDEIANQTNKEGEKNSEVRELYPGGYIINNRLFYSPELNMSFRGMLETLKFEDNKFTAETQPGVIEVLKKEDGQRVDDFIMELMENEGGNPDICKIDWFQDGSFRIETKEPYIPTEDELLNAIKENNPNLNTLDDYREFCSNNSLECTWNETSFDDKYLRENCSKYAKSSRGGYFQYATEASGSNIVLFINVNSNKSGDASWIQKVDLMPDYKF